VEARSHRPAGPARDDPPLGAGSQYTSVTFTKTVALHGLSASIGSVGDAYDNAAAESTIGLYKNEAVAAGSPFRTGPLRTLSDVETLTMNYVHW
jgi:putative transposase